MLVNFSGMLTFIWARNVRIGVQNIYIFFFYLTLQSLTYLIISGIHVGGWSFFFSLVKNFLGGPAKIWPLWPRNLNLALSHLLMKNETCTFLNIRHIVGTFFSGLAYKCHGYHIYSSSSISCRLAPLRLDQILVILLLIVFLGRSFLGSGADASDLHDCVLCSFRLTIEDEDPFLFSKMELK